MEVSGVLSFRLIQQPIFERAPFRFGHLCVAHIEPKLYVADKPVPAWPSAPNEIGVERSFIPV